MSEMVAPVEMDAAVKVFKLLGDKTRLTIVTCLMEDECCVCEFVELFGMSQPAVSQHVRKLRDAGLVEEERRGQWVFYRINQTHPLYPLVESVVRHLPEQKSRLLDLAERGLRVCCK
ncbi:ArsR/SmtB family transcription factor [Halalkalibacter oceani]|uniref:ArsR/SmtB family transcription factor n=1 Tax=Halalkalibacter oceani TaxID=1653776 RepID=UPI0033974398